jgi:hypothetical protein
MAGTLVPIDETAPPQEAIQDTYLPHISPEIPRMNAYHVRTLPDQ